MTQPAHKRRPRSAKIFSLAGNPIPDPEKPSPEVVARLKELLTLAEHGQIRGIACAFIHPDDTCSTTFRGKYCLELVGAIEMLKLGILDNIIEQT